MIRGWLIWMGIMGFSLMANATPQTTFDPSSTIWFDKPAAKWDEAIPVGNGRLGAMVFGGVKEEHVQFNEDTYWTGGPYSTVVKGGYKYLPTIQKLVFEGSFLPAHNLFGRHLMGYPVEQQKYQSLANLHIFFPAEDNAQNYRRSLDLKTGIATVEFDQNGVHYKREIFASVPDQTIVVHLTADKPKSITFQANLRGVRNQTHSDYATDYFRMDTDGPDQLVVTGKSADYLGIQGKLRYEARAKTSHQGGKLYTDPTGQHVENANSATIVFVAATNFVNYHDVSADQHKRVEQYLSHLKDKPYDTLKSAAVNDYKTLYDRVNLDLPKSESSDLPTDQRKLKNQTEPDPSLAALTFNFGRYVLISSSRPGTQPANLQGIWNNDQNPMWDSKYTTNINTEMNYWSVDSANLGELGQPLYQMIRELTDQGAQVAKEHYGASGWVFHQNTDLWRVAAPMDGPTWGTFTVGGAWLCTHLWEHYEYTQDKTFLKNYFPVLEGSVKFFLDFLVEHPDTKYLVTNPSTSPENFPDAEGNGPYFDEVTGATLPGTSICAGSAIDEEILYDLFGYYLQASQILGHQTVLQTKVAAARARLVPPQIGKSGALQEWAADWVSLEKNHRHFSHLYGLYPGRALWDQKSPALVDAIKQVLEERGDGGMGWSMAWKVALWARLNDGNRSNKILKGYFKDQSCAQLFALAGRAMQVDGTLGMTAAITEMLMQSHDDAIRLLPALPDEWPSGSLSGICARGGFELDFAWKDKRIQSVSVLSKAGLPCKIDAGQTFTVSCEGKPIPTTAKPNGILEFPTEKGKHYELTPGNVNPCSPPSWPDSSSPRPPKPAPTPTPTKPKPNATSA